MGFYQKLLTPRFILRHPFLATLLPVPYGASFNILNYLLEAATLYWSNKTPFGLVAAARVEKLFKLDGDMPESGVNRAPLGACHILWKQWREGKPTLL